MRTRFKELNRKIDFRRDLILTGKTTERAQREGRSTAGTVGAQNVGKLEDEFTEIKEGPRKGQGQFGEELIKNMDEAYTIAEETFSVPI